MQEEYDFYESEEGTTEEIQGITGKVTDYTYTNLSYPCIVFNEQFKCPKHQLTVISNMVNSVISTKDISLYFVNRGELFKMGMIDGIQISALLEIVGSTNIKGYLDKDTELSEGLLYTLCSVA